MSSLHAPRAAAQQAKAAQDVHVTNTAVDPVQVKINGTPSVTLSGVAAVSLAAGAAVQIGNPASSPALFRNVDRLTAQPVQAKLSATFNPNFAASTVGNTFTVPGGKRLVVEFVTVNITIPIGQAAQFARLDTTASSFNQYLALTQREVMLQTNLFL